MPQFLSADSQASEPPREFVATVTVTAGSLASLARVLNMMKAFEHMPGVKITSDAFGIVDTFYGYEQDVWSSQENP
jgi:hypothetical protein